MSIWVPTPANHDAQQSTGAYFRAALQSFGNSAHDSAALDRHNLNVRQKTSHEQNQAHQLDRHGRRQPG